MARPGGSRGRRGEASFPVLSLQQLQLRHGVRDTLSLARTTGRDLPAILAWPGLRRRLFRDSGSGASQDPLPRTSASFGSVPRTLSSTDGCLACTISGGLFFFSFFLQERLLFLVSLSFTQKVSSRRSLEILLLQSPSPRTDNCSDQIAYRRQVGKHFSHFSFF